MAGLTPTQVEQSITERLSKFIADANVTVVVATISSKKIYIIGAARKEGPLPYTYGMSVMQALSEAGGVTEYAKRKRSTFCARRTAVSTGWTSTTMTSLKGKVWSRTFCFCPAIRSSFRINILTWLHCKPKPTATFGRSPFRVILIKGLILSNVGFRQYLTSAC